MQNADVTFFGQTSFRGKHVKFGVKRDDKRRHIYIIGKTGMGKTELLKNMITQDIKKGNGICFVDPHGDAAEELLQFIPEDRIDDVVYFNPADLDNPIAFNIMEDVSVEYRHLIAGGIMAVFKKIWPDVWSSRMEYILNNCLLALLEVPGSTLLGINKMLSNPEWRETIVNQVKDPVIKAFWTKEFARYSQRYETEATAAIQNKIGQFISAPLIRNIIGQPNSALDMRDIMDSKKIFIVNLSKGRVGEESSRLLGALLITKLQLAAMSRVDVPEETRNDFILYIDEFQNFSTDSFASILSEARKYRLSLVLAHQYIAQMEEKVRDAVFGNVGTMIVFRVGADDAEYLEREFSPEFIVEDIVNLPKQNIYLKLMIDGVSSRPFSASTLPPVKMSGESVEKMIIEASRRKYATVRSIVEEKIARDTEDDGGAGASTTEQPRDNFNRSSELYDTICQSCNKKMKVPFKPDGKRPVYCKACLKKMEQDPESRNFKRNNTENRPKDNFRESINLERPKQAVPIERPKQAVPIERPKQELPVTKKVEPVIEYRKDVEESIEKEPVNNKTEENKPIYQKKEIKSNYIGPERNEQPEEENHEDLIRRIKEKMLYGTQTNNLKKEEEVNIQEVRVPESVRPDMKTGKPLPEEIIPEVFSIPNEVNIPEEIDHGLSDTPRGVDAHEEDRSETFDIPNGSDNRESSDREVFEVLGEVDIPEEVKEINAPEPAEVLGEVDTPEVFDNHDNYAAREEIEESIEEVEERPITEVFPREQGRKDTAKNGYISLEESARKYVPEEKPLRVSEHREVVAVPKEEQKPLETRSGKKIDFEGLLDIIKKETTSSGGGKVINPGDKIKFD
ncbi:MAG: type IV secretion system DNA-binding domain-containing protein [Candidatus Pacebacteria bacterium]|nr:type IV secretion system DNA-binding domain-containing protein [Candidatus Paceibacterota bacterium]